MQSKAEILRLAPDATLSGILPATPAPIFTPMMTGAVDPATNARTFVLANGKCDGFITRESRVGPGLTDEEQLFGFGLETPFETGKEGSLEMAEEAIFEGAQYLKTDAGTGQLTPTTPVDTLLSFTNGKFYIAQTNDFAQFRLKKQLTPTDTTVPVGEQVRIMIQRVTGIRI